MNVTPAAPLRGRLHTIMITALISLALLGPLATAGGVDTERVNAAGVGAPSGLTSSSSTALASVDFTRSEDRYEVVLGVPAGIGVSAEQTGLRVLISLPGLTVPTALQRPLDTSYFDAPVTLIAASPAASGGVVAVELRQGATWELVQSQDGFWRLVVRGDGGAPTPAPQTEPGYLGPDERALDNITGDSPGFTGDDIGMDGGTDAGPMINIDLVETDIHNALRLISEVGGVNVVADDSVQGKVTVSLHDVHWRDALTAVLMANGLSASTLDGGTLVVGSY